MSNRHGPAARIAHIDRWAEHIGPSGGHSGQPPSSVRSGRATRRPLFPFLVLLSATCTSRVGSVAREERRFGDARRRPGSRAKPSPCQTVFPPAALLTLQDEPLAATMSGHVAVAESKPDRHGLTDRRPRDVPFARHRAAASKSDRTPTASTPNSRSSRQSAGSADLLRWIGAWPRHCPAGSDGIGPVCRGHSLLCQYAGGGARTRQ